MSTQQDIYVAGSESRPPMLNKENYIPWSSRLLRYAKSRPNGKLIHNSILNGPYVRKLIPEPGDANPDINITETSHLQTDDEVSDKELKQIQADDKAIQTILLGLPKDIYAAVDSCEIAQEIWLRVHQMMKGYDIGIQEKKAKQYAGQNAGNPAGYNDVIENQNHIGNGNLVAVRAEGNAAGQNGNQIRCYNCRGIADLDDIEEVNANCILMANLQQASTSGTQSDSTPIYDTDGSAENDNDVVYEVTGVEQGGEIVEQHLANFEETRALY
nr:hypothetical protein [Tanacetum cinerariifolium]